VAGKWLYSYFRPGYTSLGCLCSYAHFWCSVIPISIMNRFIRQQKVAETNLKRIFRFISSASFFVRRVMVRLILHESVQKASSIVVPIFTRSPELTCLTHLIKPADCRYLSPLPSRTVEFCFEFLMLVGYNFATLVVHMYRNLCNVCVCLWPEVNYLWPTYLAYWCILIPSRPRSDVKFIGQGSKSQWSVQHRVKAVPIVEYFFVDFLFWPQTID